MAAQYKPDEIPQPGEREKKTNQNARRGAGWKPAVYRFVLTAVLVAVVIAVVVAMLVRATAT